MKTTTVPVSAPKWHIVDAEGVSPGRIATVVAHIVRGKHTATFSPHQLCGDHVIVINAQKIQTHGNKLIQKQYFSHSGYMGHTKSVSLKDMLIKKPEQVIFKAVQGMLPKNRLRKEAMKRVHVFAGSEHPHAPQQPIPLSL